MSHSQSFFILSTLHNHRTKSSISLSDRFNSFKHSPDDRNIYLHQTFLRAGFTQNCITDSAPIHHVFNAKSRIPHILVHRVTHTKSRYPWSGRKLGWILRALRSLRSQSLEAPAPPLFRTRPLAHPVDVAVHRSLPWIISARYGCL